jgi:hypothetical protein
MRRLFCLALGALFGVAVMGATASASGPPITFRDASTFFDSFSDSFQCQDELYAIRANGRARMHFTFFEDTGALYFHQRDFGRVVAVPLDGTGPTYTAQFWDSDTESIRAVKSTGLLVEQDTDRHHFLARGSDGSRAFFDFHAHFTVNANGEMTAQFETTRMVCA